MKSNHRGRGRQFWLVVTVGALLVGGMAIVDGAEAIELTSGLLRSDIETQCAVVNTFNSPITATITIKFGMDGSTCNSAAPTINPGQARGVMCAAPGEGTYCTVSGTFNATKIRARFANRNADGEDRAVLELR